MAKPTLLLTAAGFGGELFLDRLAVALPDTEYLGEVFRGTPDCLTGLSDAMRRAGLLDVSLSAADQAAIWSAMCDVAEERKGPTIAQTYYYHLPLDEYLWDQIAAEGRVIHLVRGNLFDSFLTREFAQQSAQWLRRRGKPLRAPLAVTVDPVAATKHVSMRQRDIEFARERLVGADYHEVIFEEIMASPRECKALIEKVFAGEGAIATGLAAEKLDRLRTRFQSNADLVTNYREVAHLDRNWLGKLE